ncbi:hypothetical protein NQ318_013202 [Aromia moschata]|uniref:Uncharacterized protein n=1 Tax=Aromia moschata TaxID=1265417 RepID=A0AAV8XHE8_9CUCU|nr:hypothetical protein NQ318_013202 [Aromia moschata]
MVKGYNALNVESTTGEQTVHLSASTKYPVVFPGSWCLRWLVSEELSTEIPVKKPSSALRDANPCSDKSKMMHHIFWPSRKKLNLNPKFVNNPSSLELLELGGSF